METPKYKRATVVKSNNDFIFIQTYSGFFNFLPDPDGKKFFLDQAVSDNDLGCAITESVLACRQVDPNSDPDFFHVRGRVIPQYEDWVSEVMAKYGYKNRKLMFKNMNSCYVDMVEEGFLIMKPSYHEKIEAWSGKGITEADYVKVPFPAPPENIGAALRVCISRCK